jgi:catalase
LSEAVTIAKGAKGFMEEFFYGISQHRCWARELAGLLIQVAF